MESVQGEDTGPRQTRAPERRVFRLAGWKPDVGLLGCKGTLDERGHYKVWSVGALARVRKMCASGAEC
jgi:hypothetical protein